MMSYSLFFFFFSSRRRHTRSDRDWSSDVCSSDLGLRQTVEDTRFILRARFRSKKKKEKVLTDRGPGERVPVTISIGVAEKSDRHAKWDLVIKAADRALYRAKEGGRNQVRT